MNKIYFATLISLFISTGSQATVSTATQRVASDLGTQEAIEASAICDLDKMIGSSGGNLGTPNTMLCLIKKLGLTGTGEATTVISIGGQSFTMHYILSSPGLTADGVTYDYSLKVWTCGTSCTTAANFLPAVFTAFSASSDGTINKGILINNYSADSGTLKGTSFIKWDVGSATTNREITLNMVDCSSSPTFAGYTVYTRNGTTGMVTLNNMSSQSTGSVSRIALAMDMSTNVGNWQEDTVVSSGGDSPAWSGGFTRTATSTDWTYASATTDSSITINPYTTKMTGALLSGATYQGVTCAGITATGGVTSVNDGTNVLTTPVTANGGMALHPDNI